MTDKPREAPSLSENEEKKEEPKKEPFKPAQAIMPISMMVILIIVTLGLALWVGPYFEAMGFTSGMSEYADNPLYAFAFLGFVIAFAVGILILKKLFKKRRLKLKYLFAFAVFTSMLYILFPLIDIAVNGTPNIWDERYFDVDNVRGALPLDPDDPGSGMILITETSFHVMKSGKYEYETIWSVEDLTKTFDPHFNSGLWVLTGRDGTGDRFWTFNNEGVLVNEGPVEHNDSSMDLLGVNVASVNETHYLLSFWLGDDKNWSLLTWEPGTDDVPSWIENIGPNEGPFYPVFGWTYGHNVFYNNESLRDYEMREWNGTLKLRGSGGFGLDNHTWIKVEGNSILYWTPDVLPRSFSEKSDNVFIGTIIDDNNLTSYPDSSFHTGTIQCGYNTSYTVNGQEHTVRGESRFIYFKGKTVNVNVNGDESKYTYPGSPIAVFQDGIDGNIYLVFDGIVISGTYEEEERMQFGVQIAAFIISAGIIVLLLKVPKWWIIDIAGILMGAGVVAMMGISFPILFTLLLMVLLAIYDAIAVYKTKHMISLADAVVESKMPILLVFPMKWSYRYEDEKNLMDPKRKRESMFMGLGDVIIPGILIVSTSAWLPKAGGTGLLGMTAPLTVSIFAIAGMLLGFGILMRWVIKGKAHAGLPPLNGGAILGFLIGHLIVYGTLIFW